MTGAGRPDRGPAGRRGAVHRRLPAVLLAGATVWTGCGWPRSSCWPPSGDTYYQRDHGWHLALADRLADAAPGLIQRTRSLLVDTTDPGSVAAGIGWW